ncbi:MAG: acyl-CoA thioesterase [Myxococcota bacterium]|nr:acyl-CoA thioesterase [Myxococcota bacterium]
MSYEQTLTVRFEDVDFARVVFFPKLFGYCHNVFEDFFKNGVGVPYAKMIQERKFGFPAVSARSDFRAPFHFGDPCRVVMDTLSLGKSSITCRYRLYQGDSEKLGAELEITTVCVAMDTFKPAPIPEDVREAFLNHLVNYQSA